MIKVELSRVHGDYGFEVKDAYAHTPVIMLQGKVTIIEDNLSP